MRGSQAYTLRKASNMLMWGFIQATARKANVKSLVANDGTEFKILTFRTY